MTIQPFQWKDKPSFIEYLLPVQKISAESYKEQMAVGGKTLTAMGSYWKGRKPLILNKACILGCLLPISDDPIKDLRVFDLLMGMDQDSMRKRLEAKLPRSRHDEIDSILTLPYSDQVREAKRPEEMHDDFFTSIWSEVNSHLGTDATSFPEFVEQIGIARFGHRPRVADVFSGSGQIPFEAARLGCNVYASDLNPIACMLTWADFNIVGASLKRHKDILKERKILFNKVQSHIASLQIEEDNQGNKAKVFLYCVEVTCPETGWKVPLLPSFVVSKSANTIVELIPNTPEKRYEIKIRKAISEEEFKNAATGTIIKQSVSHSPDGKKTINFDIKSVRGDYVDSEGNNQNLLRKWKKQDFTPSPSDIFQERLYCIQWLTSSCDYEFKSVTESDLKREEMVIQYVAKHLEQWQEKGYIPDMVIEKGSETERLYRERGWTHWHHLFTPRQLLIAAIVRQYINAEQAIPFSQILNGNSRLSRWSPNDGGGGAVKQVFYNQALNTFYNYGVRGSVYLKGFFTNEYSSDPFSNSLNCNISCHPAQDLETENDIYITDPPYGDAVKYEEITEFFIAWLRKNPPKEFSNWIWDSRRSLAITGEGEGFRRGMIDSYAKMAQKMPDNGIQVLMFTHQSGSIWADMASIIWAAGLQVSAAWYIVTETDSALRQGANVKGTVILVLRKRKGQAETYRDDLGWELEDAVKKHVESLISLDKQVRELSSQGLYTDADLQMAGYAAALKVLTSYSCIDGKDMVMEAAAPRSSNSNTEVHALIDFAVKTAIQFLIPQGIDDDLWQSLEPVEKFYMKMIEMEERGANTLDNYQNFAKAFKVRDRNALMSSATRANSTRLKLSDEFGRTLMTSDSEIGKTKLRALLYAIQELRAETETPLVLAHLADNCSNYLQSKRILVLMARFIAEKRKALKPNERIGFYPDKEARAADILAEALQMEKL